MFYLDVVWVRVLLDVVDTEGFCVEAELARFALLSCKTRVGEWTTYLASGYAGPATLTVLNVVTECHGT